MQVEELTVDSILTAVVLLPEVVELRNRKFFRKKLKKEFFAFYQDIWFVVSWYRKNLFRISHRRCCIKRLPFRAVTLSKKRLQHRCFPVNIAKFFIEHLRSLLLHSSQSTRSQKSLHKKWSFPLRISLVNVTKIAEEILNGKLHFLCRNIFIYVSILSVQRTRTLSFMLTFCKLCSSWVLFSQIWYPTSNYMFKVNNRNTRTRCEICSKLTIEAPDRRLALMFLLLILNM